MGTIKSGINGPFSGKTGSVIGSSWRKIHYMTGLHDRSNKKPSDRQLSQRSKFSLMTDFLAPLTKVLKLGFSGENTSNKTAYNLAMGYNMRWAVTGESPDLKIDYHRVVLSRGNLPKLFKMKLETVPRYGFRISWPTSITNGMLSPDDRLIVVAFDERLGLSLVKDDAVRSDGEIVIETNKSLLLDIFHVFVFFNSPKGNNSGTQYLGEVRAGEEEKSF